MNENGLQKPNGRIETTSLSVSGSRPKTLQKLLEKDTEQLKLGSRDKESNDKKGLLSAVVNNEEGKSFNKDKYSTNISKVLQSKCAPENPMRNSDSARNSAKVEIDSRTSTVQNAEEITRSTINGKSFEEKLKLKKSMSPSLNALIEKDAQNSQRFHEDKKDVWINEIRNKESCKEASNGFDNIEVKVSKKAEKSSENPVRKSFGNVFVLSEKPTRYSSKRERDVISRKISSYSQKNDNLLSIRPKLSCDSKTKAGKISREFPYVEMSMNDEDLLFSVRERRNKLTKDQQNVSSSEKTTTTHRKECLFTLRDVSNALSLHETIQDKLIDDKRKHENFVIVEDGLTPGNVQMNAECTSVEEISSNSQDSDVSGNIEKNQRVFCGQYRLEKSEIRIGIKAGDNHTKQINIANKSGDALEHRSISKSLADLLAKDETLDSNIIHENGAQNSYLPNDKTKELKRTTLRSAPASSNPDNLIQSTEKTREIQVHLPCNNGIEKGDFMPNSSDVISHNHINGCSAFASVKKTKDIKSNTNKLTSSEETACHINGRIQQVIPSQLNQGTNHNRKHDHVVSTTTSSSVLRPSPLREMSNFLANGGNLSCDHELKKLVAEFEVQKQDYEAKITELQLQLDDLRRQESHKLKKNGSISDITSSYSPCSTPVLSRDNSSLWTTSNLTPLDLLSENVVTCKSPVAPPPPTPPFLPGPPLVPENNARPSKPIIKPKAEMKPLFWQRIISSNESMTKVKCIWSNIKEPVIDTNEFERLFSKKVTGQKFKRTKSLRDDKHFAHINGKKVAKLLETNRSRAIGIKMSSLNCQLEDIINAVYNMDTSVVDMESLQSIYDIYPREEEIEMINEHLKKIPSVPLDKPEEFVHQLTKMKSFKERLECWLFQDKFTEIICGTERSLMSVIESCEIVTTNSDIAVLLSLILAYGNYMNGNTHRGQADGFHLDVLLKLKDVKAKDCDINLLQYTVKQYQKRFNKGDSPLPSHVSFFNAAQVSFEKLKEELIKLSQLVHETEAQVSKILDECSPVQRYPFEENMRRFEATAKQKISEQREKLTIAENNFHETVEYFQWESITKKETPQEFFGLWAKFVDEVKTCIKMEKQQHQLVKRNFIKVEHLNQIREAATKFQKRRQNDLDVLT